MITPRIPDEPAVDEDVTTCRISMAPTIKDCLRGIGCPRDLFEDNRIRVYSFEICESSVDLYNSQSLYNNGLVPDAPITHEYWYLNAIKPDKYYEYSVSGIEYKDYYVIAPKYKEKLTTVITDLCHVKDKSLCNKTAIDILNLFGESQYIDEIEKRMVHKESNPDYSPLYEQIFKEKAEPYQNCPDYYMSEYIEDCKLTLL